MKKNLTEIVFILDESGSMQPLAADTIGGFNSLVEKQKKEKGEAIVSTVLFSYDSKVIHDRVPLDKVKELTASDYCPSGSTALFDAVGEAVHHIGNIHKYAREEDVPERTLFVITTDGMENASRRYSSEKVKKMIEKKQKKHGWEFIFLGANIDSAETAESIGIARGCAVDYHSDRKGTGVLYRAVESAMSCVRSGKSLAAAAEWREEADMDMKRR